MSRSDRKANGLHKRGLLAELKHRKVIRVGVTYAAVGWLVIQIAETTFPSLGIPGWAERFVIMAVVLCFPIALVLAWAFELTPQGLMTTRQAIRTASSTAGDAQLQKSRNRLALMGAAFIPTAIFAALAGYFYMQVPAKPEVSKSIAVLPFQNRSKLENDAFFVDGIHDDLLTQISYLRDIKTISRTSVMAYRDTSKNLRTIGRELGVSTILEGGVQRSGDRIRVNVQLIDAATDAHLWAEIYTREMSAENVFLIQSEIAMAIATQLRLVLSPEEERQLERLPTENLAALEAYFRGNAAPRDTGAGYREAARHYREAIELDPNFAAAYARLATAELRLVYFAGLPEAMQAAKAAPLVAHALELDPALSDAYVAQGRLRRYQADLAGAESAFLRAIELSPGNVDAYLEFGDILSWALVEPDRAAEHLRKAVELDPRSWSARQELAAALMLGWEFAEAEALLEELIAEEPGRTEAYTNLGQLYSWFLCRYGDAIRVSRQLQELDPENSFVALHIAQSYTALGLVEQALVWYRHALDLWSDSENSTVVRGLMYLAQGDRDTASDVLLEVSPASDLFGYAARILASEELVAGDAKAVLARLEEGFPQLVGPGSVLNWITRDSVGDYVAALLLNGERERAERVAETLLSQAATAPSLIGAKAEALIQLALGNEDRAVLAYSEWAAAGGCLAPDALGFRDITNNPRFSGFLLQMAECTARQEQQLAEREALGELPPPPL